MFLTPVELIELTDRKKLSLQVQFLVKNGIRHLVSPSGKPKVLKSEVNRLLFGGTKTISNPDFSHING